MKKNIVSVSLVLSGRGYSKEYRSSYNRYRVLVNVSGSEYAGIEPKTVPLEDLFTREELKELVYWSPRSQMMSMTCWGTSQSFEAQLALASFLGMGEGRGDWGDYTRKVHDKIRVV